MKSIMIADTTREERERIVAESIGNINGACDGCSPGLLRMYQDYIDGRKELREINLEFRARYTSGAMGPDTSPMPRRTSLAPGFAARYASTLRAISANR